MKVCIFGGNGFVGSAIARKAVARGWSVISVSRSGTPFTTPAGHTPAWVHQVDWRKGSPFDPATYAALLPECDALVTTLGTLLETPYKHAGVPQPLSVLRAVAENLTGSRGNPLAPEARERSYERLNRDAALALLDAFQSSRPEGSLDSTTPSPFVFISAEDIFRPFVPARYVQTKRQAEAEIWRRTRIGSGAEGEGGEAGASASADGTRRRRIRPILVRPSLMYHPHLNPPSTLPATVLEATARLHALVPPSWHLLPSAPPSGLAPDPDAGLPGALTSVSGLLSIPPIHVDAVGSAVCAALEDETVEGVLDVERMRELVGLDPLGGGGRGASRGKDSTTPTTDRA